MTTFNIIFFGLYGTLFSTPIVAILFRKTLLNFRTKAFQICSAMIFIITIAKIFKLTLVGVSANAILLFAIYLLFGICAVQLAITKNSKFLAIAGKVAMLPLLILPVISVPALLAVAFIAGDAEPIYEYKNTLGYLCRVTSYGNATTSKGGYLATLYSQHIFVEQKLNSASVDNTGNKDITPQHACEVAAKLLKR